MEKFFKNVEKAVIRGIDAIDGSLTKTNQKITETEIMLSNFKSDRSLYEKFLDKLDRILSILKE